MATAAQQEILDEMAGKPGGKPAPKKKATPPKGPRRYMAMPGYSLVGAPAFPFETKSKTMQKFVEKSRGFKRGRIWIEMRDEEARKATETNLEGMNETKLRTMCEALGHRNLAGYKKYELLDILMKEGF